MHSYTRTQAGIFVESPSWPLLVELAGASGLRLALLNARMGSAWFKRYYYSAPGRAMLGQLMDRFTLIVPQSDVVSYVCVVYAVCVVCAVFACVKGDTGAADGRLHSHCAAERRGERSSSSPVSCSHMQLLSSC